MNSAQLSHTAQTLLTPSKGILALDESIHTATKRLENIQLESTAETRRQYRDLFLSTPGIEAHLSGVILFDETLQQASNNGANFIELLHDHGILAGIKVDRGTIDLPDFPGEKLTQGLDDLSTRLAHYRELGTTFAKWRSVITISRNTPTIEALTANSLLMAEYANLCQQNDILPIVEPEVLYEGDHTLERAEEVTGQALMELFTQLKKYRVDLEYLILKTSMVLPGSNSPKHVPPKVIAESTTRVLKKTVPAEVPGIVFLSGGQSSNQAINNLNAIAKNEPLPWEIAFSYARALQEPAMSVWQGQKENWGAAQTKFLETLREATLADKGQL